MSCIFLDHQLLVSERLRICVIQDSKWENTLNRHTWIIRDDTVTIYLSTYSVELYKREITIMRNFGAAIFAWWGINSKFRQIYINLPLRSQTPTTMQWSSGNDSVPVLHVLCRQQNRVEYNLLGHIDWKFVLLPLSEPPSTGKLRPRTNLGPCCN